MVLQKCIFAQPQSLMFKEYLISALIYGDKATIFLRKHAPFGRLRCILLTFCVHFVNKMFQNVQQNAYRHECIFYLLISHPNRLRSTIVLAKCQVLLMQKYIFAYILLAKCSKMFTNPFLHQANKFTVLLTKFFFQKIQSTKKIDLQNQIKPFL